MFNILKRIEYLEYRFLKQDNPTKEDFINNFRYKNFQDLSRAEKMLFNDYFSTYSAMGGVYLYAKEKFILNEPINNKCIGELEENKVQNKRGRKRKIR